jgi:hypothetical protein
MAEWMVNPARALGISERATSLGCRLNKTVTCACGKYEQRRGLPIEIGQVSPF